MKCTRLMKTIAARPSTSAGRGGAPDASAAIPTGRVVVRARRTVRYTARICLTVVQRSKEPDMPRKHKRERKFFAWWIVPSRAAYRKWLKRVAGTKWDPCARGL